MFAEPLNGLKDAKPERPRIAGHSFHPFTNLCACGKTFAMIASAPVEDIDRSDYWCHSGVLNRREYDEIQLEKQRIFDCCRS